MSGADPLGLDPETMRELGYRTVDLLVDWLHDDEAPPLRRARPSELQARLSGPLPAEGTPFEEILAALEHDVLPFGSRVFHPSFFAFIPGSGTWPGALGDFVASAANVYAGSWMESAGVVPARARGHALVRGVDRPPADRRGPARQRWVGGERDGAGLRARAAGRRDGAEPRRLPPRPGSLVARAGGPRAGLRAGSAARPSRGRRAPAAAAACSPVRWRPTPPRGSGRCSSRPAAGRRTPAPSIRSPSSPRSRASTAPGSTSTPRTAASRR